MNISINENELANKIRRQIFDLVDPVQDAMAQRFLEMTLSNFGIAGADRPIEWAPLSYAYSLKVGRKIATLYVTGALKGAIHQNDNEVEVNDAEVPYATAHQYGNDRLPARPYFPLRTDGECLPYTFSQVVEAGQNKLDSIL